MIRQPSSSAAPRRTEPDAEGAFRHVALFYRGRESLVQAVAAFVRDGIAVGEPALVTLTADKLDLLRVELGDVSGEVMFADMAEVGANPGRLISEWDDFFAARAAEGLRVRGVGEPIWVGRSDAEVTECHHHEALLNMAFAGASGFSLVCPYDVDALEPEVVEHARVTHPWVVDDGTERPSPVYDAHAVAASISTEPLEDPPASAYEVAFDRESLTAVRSFVGELAIDAGILGVRRDDLILAVSELVTNSVRHGGGQGVLRIWHEGYSLVCEVSDRGRIDPPLAGRRRPRSEGLSGYGLWLVHQLCDLVQVRASGGGNVVRMRMRRG